MIARHTAALAKLAKSSYFRSKLIDGVNALPRKIGIFTSKMSIRRRPAKDGAPELKMLDHASWR